MIYHIKYKIDVHAVAAWDVRQYSIDDTLYRVYILSFAGITWVFGLVATGGASDVFAVLFCLLNTLQGFFIFILYCMRSEDVREAWMSELPFVRVCCQPAPEATNKTNIELVE